MEKPEIKIEILGAKNPVKGRIEAEEIGELWVQPQYVDENATEIICDKIKIKKVDHE